MSKDDVWETVIEEMHERRKLGIERYNCPVHVSDGRKTLNDLYEELQDAIVYVRKEIFKFEEMKARIRAAAEKSYDTEAALEIITILNEYI